VRAWIRGQGGPEACNVPQMKEGSFGDVVGVGEEREGGVKDDAEVVDLGGGGEDGAIDIEREGLGRAGEGVRAEDEYFRFVRVEFVNVSSTLRRMDS